LSTDKELAGIKKRIEWLNMIPNFFWSAVFLIPIAVYCFSKLDSRLFYFFLAISMVTLFLPISFFNFLQLSWNPSFYKRIGIRFVNKFAQHGEWLNKYIRKKYPAYKTLSVQTASVQKKINQAYFFEKFHFSLLVFFLLVTISAIVENQIKWIIILLVCNLLYNVYPILLQQYIRAKLQGIKGRNPLDSTRSP